MGKAKRSLADQLFDFEGIDLVADGVDVFINVTLKAKIGNQEFLPGKTFTHATLDSNVSKITFFEKLNDENGHTYNLELKIGEEVK